VAITSAGSGYASGLATVGGGTRAAGGHDPVVRVTATAGAVTAVAVEDPGSMWSVAPTLTPPGGGTGAVLAVTLGAIQAIELGPVPDEGGTLELRYTAALTAMVDGTDELGLDAEAMIGRAAMVLAGIKRLPSSDMLVRLHSSYMNKLEPRQVTGETMSLSGWRRDDRLPLDLRRRA
jgi:hypothetical protein